MSLKTCERCHVAKDEWFFKGHSGFMMPWCRECRSLDPRGAKLVNDRVRHARLTKVQLAEKNEKRARRAREIRQEARSARETACQLALEALAAIDLSLYEGNRRREIASELARIKEVVRALKR